MKLKYYILFFVLFVFLFWLIFPFRNWFELSVICEKINPLSPLNPAIVNGVLKSLGSAYVTLLSVYLLFSKDVSKKRKLLVVPMCAAMIYGTVDMYSSGHAKIERALSADTARAQSYSEMWCER